ncbi:MAG: hypothetical protein PHV51_07740, partial [Methanosarcinaceae archaeon]|nr:hypothetical protein [Methanosarcinaceae archaeon]
MKVNKVAKIKIMNNNKINSQNHFETIDFINILFLFLCLTFMVMPIQASELLDENNHVAGNNLSLLESGINVTFGKLNVFSEGIDGQPLNCYVYVYEESESSYVDYGSTGSDGVISFYLAPGNYKVKVRKSNYIWKENLLVVSGKKTNTTAVFGLLKVRSEGVDGKLMDSYVYVYDQGGSSYIDYGSTGSDGEISFYLAPGNYKARACESNNIWRENLAVSAG